MANRRLQRLNEQLKREISHLLRTEVRDPRVGTVTVTGVEASPDLTVARVWVQISGDQVERAEGLLGLAAAAAFIRRQLAGILETRRVPELTFQEDRTLAHATRIESLLRDVKVTDDALGEGEADPGPSVSDPKDEES